MTIDPELTDFIAGVESAWPVSPITLPIDEWRIRVDDLARSKQPPHPADLKVSHMTVPGCDGRRVGLRIYQPQADTPLPGLLFFHGGGWVVGSSQSHDIATAALASQTPAVVVSVDYALAPEHPFPAAYEDSATALDYVQANLDDLGIAPGALCVGGDSAGGNLSAALAIAYRGKPAAPAGQMLFYPCLDTDFNTASYRDEADAPYLKAAEMIWFWDQYCPDPAMRNDPRAVPMREASHAGLAPALILAAEHDPLREDAYAYAKKLRADGTEVILRPGTGLIHGFLRAAAFSRAARAEYDAASAWLREVGR